MATSFLGINLSSLIHLESGILGIYLYYFPALFSLISLSQALPPSPSRVPLTLPLLALLSTQLCLHKWNASHTQVIGAVEWLWQYVFLYFDRVFFANPDKEGWHRVAVEGSDKGRGEVGGGKKVYDDDGKKDDGKDMAEVPKTFRTRLWWSFSSMLAARGVGWSWQVRGVPPAPKSLKWEFIAKQMMIAGLIQLVTGPMVHYVANTPYADFEGESKVLAPSGAGPLREQLSFTVVLLVMQYCGLYVMGSVSNTITVGLGLAQPDECPPFAGSPMAAYTVRNLWSVTWHQFMRRSCFVAGNLTAHNFLGLRRQTALSRCVKVTMAFFISAVYHGLGTWSVIGQGFRSNMIFFMLQPLAILFEEQVIAAGRRAGLKDRPLWRMVGYAWTSAWIVCTFRILAADWAGLLRIPWRPWDLFGVGDWMNSGKS